MPNQKYLDFQSMLKEEYQSYVTSLEKGVSSLSYEEWVEQRTLQQIEHNAILKSNKRN